MELASSNKPEQVESITSQGLGAMPDVEKAIKILSQLHGVGPATASGQAQNLPTLLMNLLTVAIVTAAYPDSAAFMADESYNAVYPDSKINYTLVSYLAYLQQLKMKAEELSKAGEANQIKIFITQHHGRQNSLECSQSRIGSLVTSLHDSRKC